MVDVEAAPKARIESPAIHFVEGRQRADHDPPPSPVAAVPAQTVSAPVSEKPLPEPEIFEEHTGITVQELPAATGAVTAHPARSHATETQPPRRRTLLSIVRQRSEEPAQLPPPHREASHAEDRPGVLAPPLDFRGPAHSPRINPRSPPCPPDHRR